ncbi:MAG: MFS transporter [Deltaproteobacteria bacterium]|nr:MFS transporter [Deltaproteobacteria bacterium]
MAPREETEPLFFGWRMVGVAFVVEFIAVGFFFYSFGVYFKAIDAELAGSRLGVSLGLMVTSAVGGIIAPFMGRALDRYPIKRIMLMGAVALSVAFALLSRVTAIWQFYLVLGTFFAFGMSMMGGLATAKLVANWFQARRGTALGIAGVGISLSGFVMPPVAAWLVSELGWRGGFLVYALGTLAVVVPVVALFVVNRPEDMGLRPDGAAPEPEESHAASADVSWSTRQILRSRNFWAIALPFAMSFSMLSAILIHLVPHATDIGIPMSRAAWVLSFAAGAGAVGKLLFGRLVDLIEPRLTIWISFGTQLAGLLVIMQEPGYTGLVAGAVVFGLGMGGVVPLQGAVAGLAFGRLSFGKVMGLMRPVQAPLGLIGVPLAGWIYDTTGGYDLAWKFFCGVYVVASLLVAALSVRRAPRP